MRACERAGCQLGYYVELAPVVLGATLAARARGTRRSAGTTRRPAADLGEARRAAQPRQLPPPRVGARDRGRRHQQASEDLRPALHPRNAVAAGIGVSGLARVIGTSIEMIERHY